MPTLKKILITTTAAFIGIVGSIILHEYSPDSTGTLGKNCACHKSPVDYCKQASPKVIERMNSNYPTIEELLSGTCIRERDYCI